MKTFCRFVDRDIFARFCGFGPGHKPTRNITQLFRDDIKDAFGLVDDSEIVAGDDDDDDDMRLEVSGDGDVEMDEEDSEEPEDLDSEGGEDDDLNGLGDEGKDEDEGDENLDGWVDELGYGAL